MQLVSIFAVGEKFWKYPGVLLVSSHLSEQIALDIPQTPCAGAAGVLGGLIDEKVDQAIAVVLALVDNLERLDLRAFLLLTHKLWK